MLSWLCGLLPCYAAVTPCSVRACQAALLSAKLLFCLVCLRSGANSGPAAAFWGSVAGDIADLHIPRPGHKPALTRTYLGSAPKKSRALFCDGAGAGKGVREEACAVPFAPVCLASAGRHAGGLVVSCFGEVLGCFMLLRSWHDAARAASLLVCCCLQVSNRCILPGGCLVEAAGCYGTWLYNTSPCISAGVSLAMWHPKCNSNSRCKALEAKP